jgi:hypothetical protein
MQRVLHMLVQATLCTKQQTTEAFLTSVMRRSLTVATPWTQLRARVAAAVPAQQLHQENVAQEAHPVIHRFVLFEVPVSSAENL